MNRKILIPAAIAAMLLGAASAHAESDRDGRRVMEQAEVKVTLQQALETAEQHAGGKAREAELEYEDGRGVYEVKVRTKDATRKVYVDASDGSIVAGDDGRRERSDD